MEAEKAMQKLKEERASITELTQYNEKLHIQQLAETKHMFDTKPYQNGIPAFQQLPKWIQSFFKFGKLPIYLFNLL